MESLSSNIEEQKLWYKKLKTLGDSLCELSSDISRNTSKHIGNTLSTLLDTLRSIENPNVIMTAINIQCVIFPLIDIYKSMTPEQLRTFEAIVEPWLKIYHFLLSETYMKIWMPSQIIIKTFVSLLIFIKEIEYEKDNSPLKNLPNCSEEIKLIAIECLSAALPAKLKEGRHNSFIGSQHYDLAISFQQENFIPIAAACITDLLSIAKQQQNIKLRMNAIHLISQLLHDNIRDIDTIAKLMPGVASKLCAIISQKAEKENHQVTCVALDALGELIKAVLRDDLNETLVEINSFEDVFNKQKGKEVDTLRNKEWYQKTNKSLSNVLSQVLHIRIYPDWRARLAFVEFSYSILTTCSNSLTSCVKPLLEILVLHTDDTFTQVSNACRIRMQLLISSPSFENMIIPILKSNLYDWMMKFPQIIISKDEQEKANVMTLISGYILLLGKQAESVLSTVMSRISDSWMTALEIDRDSVHVLEEREVQRYIELNAEDDYITPIYPKIRFKHVVSDSTVAKLNRLINVIGKHCDLQSWIHHFMRYIFNQDNVFNDPQAAFIIFALLSGSTRDITSTFEIDEFIYDLTISNEDELKLNMITAQLLNDIMNTLTNTAMNNENHLSLVTKASEDIDEESGYILTVCFCLQIVGTSACILERDELQEHFITMLYPLLAYLGSNNVFIHTYALITLDTIALKCGLQNAKELAINNIDYIINMISQHISVLSSNIKVPLVLKALIHVGGYACIQYLDDSVDEIFDALERYSLNEWICNQLCGVLLEILQTLEKNENNVKKEQKTDAKAQHADGISPEIQAMISNLSTDVDEKDEGIANMEEIGKYFLDRQKKESDDKLALDQTLEGLQDESLDLQDQQAKKLEEINNEMNKSEKVPLTHEQVMTKNIMEKASHFLAASSPQLRSQILALLTSGIMLLSNNAAELNPLIHSMWQPIVYRLEDPQNYIVLHAANLIEQISQVCTDFLTSKFEKDLWPRFKVILQKGVRTAVTDAGSTNYSIYSVYYRTQKCIFQTLAQIAYHVPLKQNLVKDILEETKFYYKNSQVHENLSDSCQELFKALATQESDTVWLYSIAVDSPYQPPSPLLDTFKAPDWFSLSYYNVNFKFIKFK